MAYLDADVPMVLHCDARESGGVRCEVLVVPGTEHHHWISDETIRRGFNPYWYEQDDDADISLGADVW